MEKMNVLTLIITLVVGVILAGSLLGPVINNVTETERTFDNTDMSIVDMKPFEVGDTWARDSVTGAWSLNGETVSNLNQGAYSAILTETLAGRSNGQFRGVTVTGNMAGASGVVVDETTLTLSGTGLTGSASQTYTQGYGLTDKGDYVLTKYLTDRGEAYLLDTTEIYATGTTAGNTVVNVVVHIEGNIKDGVTVTATPLYNTGTNKTTSVDNIVIDCEKVEGYVNLYKFKQITFDITETDTSTSETETVSASFSALVMPKTITAELAQHLTPGQNSLIGAIPIMVIVALLMTAVGAIALRRND